MTDVLALSVNVEMVADRCMVFVQGTRRNIRHEILRKFHHSADMGDDGSWNLLRCRKIAELLKHLEQNHEREFLAGTACGGRNKGDVFRCRGVEREQLLGLRSTRKGRIRSPFNGSHTSNPPAHINCYHIGLIDRDGLIDESIAIHSTGSKNKRKTGLLLLDGKGTTVPILAEICIGNHSTRLKPASVRCRYTQEDKLEACPPYCTIDVF